MVRWQIEPMSTWMYPETKARRNNPFAASWQATMDLLTRELDHLDVVGAVALRVVGDQSDVRRDGMLRASARLVHPGVAVSFQSRKHGPLTYPCDTFSGTSGGLAPWQANARAIALGLEALRRVERYGIASRGEQYAGWRAIGSGTEESPFTSRQEAVAWLAKLTESSTLVPAPVLLKRGAAVAHPDRNGGDTSLWERYDAARQLLGGGS